MLDYDFIMHKVNQIDELAYRLKKMSDETERIIETGRPGWRGEAASEYYRSCLALKNKLALMAEKTKDFSLSIKNAADRKRMF